MMKSELTATKNSKKTLEKLKSLAALQEGKDKKEKEVHEVEAIPLEVIELKKEEKPVAVKEIEDLDDFDAWAENKDEVRASNGRGESGDGVISVVNSKNGKRVKLSDLILDSLNSPEAVRILTDKEAKELMIFRDDKNSEAHILKGKMKVNTIYSSELVLKITEIFDLDFMIRTSITFGTCEVKKIHGKTVVVITSEIAENVDEGDVE